jgi:hypothetical protein
MVSLPCCDEVSALVALLDKLWLNSHKATSTTLTCQQLSVVKSHASI